MNELIKRLEDLAARINELVLHLQLPQKKQKVLELEDKMSEAGFWQDSLKAQAVTQEHSQLKELCDFWDGLDKSVAEILELARQNTDESEEARGYLEKQLADLEKLYKNNRFVALLSKKYDDHNAIFSVHSGAGGLDAQDWAEMLLRMYLRYCEKRGLKTEILELNRGQEGGVKSAVVEAHGPFAYGLLKSEAGVHRLVRQSPFNQAHTRETSFALLELLPLLEEVEKTELDPKDLKIETTTSSGHGGQSVNTTYSAVRITHIPTGIKVSIQNERSQHQNRELAMKILQSKIKTLEEEKLQKEKLAIRGEFKSAEWGNQIRSYVLHPYKLVKDHRTGLETSDPDSVLDGNLEDFVEKYLEKTVSGQPFKP